jgi:hypothetical protein
MSAQSRWKALDSLRNGVLDRARQAAALTIPALLPEIGQDENSQLPQPYQSLGARGVNNLASKLLLALLPTTSAFFRYSVDQKVADKIKDKQGLEDALRRRENKVMKWIERSNLRTTLFQALKLLVATGNALLFLPKKGPARTFRLDQYCVVRDPNGVVTEIVIREVADPRTLPKNVVEHCQVKIEDAPTGTPKHTEIFTHWKMREGGEMCDYWQEINDRRVPGSKGQARIDENPYIALRWTAIDNENYGRGHVEEYIGDLRSLEGLSMAIVGFSAVAAKVIFLVHPNATTNIDDLTVAHSGDFVTGSLKDIEALQLDKFNDFRVSREVLQDLILRLSHAFLLTSGTVRDAERVTAEEVRMQAQELEDVLGGVYTVQSQELQLPLVARITHVMEESKLLERLPRNIGVEASIVTGFEALGRGHELNRIRNFFADVANTFGPETLAAYVKRGQALKQFAIAHNVDIEDLLKTDDEVQAEQEAAQQRQMQAEMAMRAAGPAAGAAVKGLADNVNSKQ